MPKIADYDKAVDQRIGSNIRFHRKLCGLTCVDLAQSVGVTMQQMQKYEKGINRVSASRLYTISQTLNVDIKVLFSDMDAEDRDDNALISHKSFTEERKKMALFAAYSNIENPKIRDQIVSLALELANKH